MKDYKDIIGKVLLTISILLCIYMFFSPLNYVLLEIDEYFTFSLIKFSFMQGITITANDVHPPLYYIILKVILKLLNTVNIQYNLLYVLKIISIIPYMIIVLISSTKIRKEYNWLTAGLFSLSLIIMSEFFIYYQTIRMYSWALLFLLLSFIYLKDIILKSDNKSWILFTVFSVLCAYTHYFTALSSFLLYLILFLYILIKKDKINLKKWVLSTVLAVIAYAPWLSILISQMHVVHENYWIPQIDFDYFIKCISYFAVNNGDFMINTISNYSLELFSILILIFIIILSIKEYRHNKSSENMYMLIGIFLFISTILFGLLLSVIFRPIIRVRYLLPAIAVFWFAASILIGKIQNNKITYITLFIILVLGCCCFTQTIDSSFNVYENSLVEQNIFNEIKSDDSIILVPTDPGFMNFGMYINQSNVYIDVDGLFGLSNKEIKQIYNYKLVSTDKYKKVIEKNPDKKIYTIEPTWGKLDLGKKYNRTEVYHIHDSFFTIYSLNKTNIS